ncbi:MAG: long-chain-fatty-acid--CoA ligase [Janthinobacterium lividum]
MNSPTELASTRSKYWPKGLPVDLHLPRTSLSYNLTVAATRYPDKPAYVYYENPFSYSAMLRQAEYVAGFLQQRCGVEHGDRVLLMGQTSPQFATAVHAIFRADAVVVPFNPMNLTEEIAHALSDSGARVAIVAQELFERIEPLLGDALQHVVVFAYSDALAKDIPADVPDWVRAPRRPVAHASASAWVDVQEAALEPSAHRARSQDAALICYTSGTTGKPKGCVHTHASLMTAAITPTLWRGDRPDTVVLGVMPMFHMQGMQSIINSACYVGCTVVLLPRWDVRSAARLIERYRVHVWGVSPAMLLDLLALPDLHDYDISSLAFINGGGAGFPAAVNKRLTEELGIRYLEGWGMTETASMAMCNPPDRTKRQCLGIPTFGVEACVIDAETGAVLGDGETGELWVTGGQVMRGYWNNPTADAETFRDIGGRRFMRSGDLVYRDDEGYYFMVDRLKRMINASGFKVWPAEVESMLHHHPAISEACIIATRDARRGEAVKAVVVLRKDYTGAVSEQDLIGWTREQMASYKCPRSVDFVERLPRGGTGKIDWRRLQDEEKARVAAVSI